MEANKANKAQDKANKAPATPARIDRATMVAGGRQPDAAAALATLVAFAGADGAVTPADVAVVTGKEGKAVRDAIRDNVPRSETDKRPLGRLKDLGLSGWSFPVSGKYLARLLAHLYAGGAGRGARGAATTADAGLTD